MDGPLPTVHVQYITVGDRDVRMVFFDFSEAPEQLGKAMMSLGRSARRGFGMGRVMPRRDDGIFSVSIGRQPAFRVDSWVALCSVACGFMVAPLPPVEFNDWLREELARISSMPPAPRLRLLRL